MLRNLTPEITVSATQNRETLSSQSGGLIDDRTPLATNATTTVRMRAKARSIIQSPAVYFISASQWEGPHSLPTKSEAKGSQRMGNIILGAPHCKLDPGCKLAYCVCNVLQLQSPVLESPNFVCGCPLLHMFVLEE